MEIYPFTLITPKHPHNKQTRTDIQHILKQMLKSHFEATHSSVSEMKFYVRQGNLYLFPW